MGKLQTGDSGVFLCLFPAGLDYNVLNEGDGPHCAVYSFAQCGGHLRFLLLLDPTAADFAPILCCFAEQ